MAGLSAALKAMMTAVLSAEMLAECSAVKRAEMSDHHLVECSAGSMAGSSVGRWAAWTADYLVARSVACSVEQMAVPKAVAKAV